MESEESHESAPHEGSKARKDAEDLWAHMLDQAPSFSVALGQRLAEIRKSEKRTTEQVARQAQLLGLTWHRTTVGQTELGRRSLSAVELLLLPLLYGKPLRDLLPDETTWLTDATAVFPEELWGAIEGNWDRPGAMRHGPGRWHLKNRPSTDDMIEAVAAWANRSAERWPHGALAKHVAPPDEAESKAAKKLGTTPHYVAYAARELWGHGLVAEREARLVERGDLPDSPRALQAARGHITRSLIEELAPAIRAHEEKRGEPEGFDWEAFEQGDSDG
jgi:transcriptional regulator with XRE-family HTH domain